MPTSALQASHDNLLSRILQDPSDSSLLPAILWLLLAQEMLALPPIDGTAVSAVLTVIASGLKETDTTLALQTALDCFSLTLALPEVQSGMDDAWLATTVSLVSGLVGSSGKCVALNKSKTGSFTTLVKVCMCWYPPSLA